ncbi:MAG TPA: hypothetical protein VGF99_09935 [Myxococcota bacterium]
MGLRPLVGQRLWRERNRRDVHLQRRRPPRRHEDRSPQAPRQGLSLNYLAHSLAFIDDGADDGLRFYRVAGTSLPDWLRVVDKHARLRPDVLAAVDVGDDARFDALREGAQRHHDDDHRFHLDEAFDVHSADLAARFRLFAPGLRASTLGHILTEMLVDAALMQRDPTLLPRYYAGLASLDDDVIVAFSRRATQRPLSTLPLLLQRFRNSRFLELYASDDGLLDCLVGVCERAGLVPPPRSSTALIAQARTEVAPIVARFFGASS